MWLFFPEGFISVVQKDPSNPDLTVRARNEWHLRAVLAAYLPDRQHLPITKHAGTDYPVRVVLPRSDFVRLLTASAQKLSYGNFKSAAQALHGAKDPYTHMLHAVWRCGLKLEDYP